MNIPLYVLMLIEGNGIWFVWIFMKRICQFNLFCVVCTVNICVQPWLCDLYNLTQYNSLRDFIKLWRRFNVGTRLDVLCFHDLIIYYSFVTAHSNRVTWNYDLIEILLWLIIIIITVYALLRIVFLLFVWDARVKLLQLELSRVRIGKLETGIV